MNYVAAMSKIHFCKVILVFISLATSLHPCRAKTSNDFGQWNFVTITIPITDKLFCQEVINTRVQDNFSELSTLFLRSGLAYQVHPQVSLWVGHDWFGFFGEKFSHDNAIWGQALITHKHNKYSFMHRIRQEHNFIPHQGDIVTLRYMARMDRKMPFSKNPRIGLIVWNEAFVNYNSNDTSNAGFVQNRIFTGAGYKFNEHMALELGYMLQHINNDDDKLNHWLLSNIVINL